MFSTNLYSGLKGRENRLLASPLKNLIYGHDFMADQYIFLLKVQQQIAHEYEQLKATVSTLQRFQREGEKLARSTSKCIFTHFCCCCETRLLTCVGIDLQSVIFQRVIKVPYGILG